MSPDTEPLFGVEPCTFRFRWKSTGPHVHFRLFVLPGLSDGTPALCAKGAFRSEEWRAFLAIVAQKSKDGRVTVEFVEEP